MVKNISSLFGVPSNLKAGKQQHKVLVKKLKNKKVFFLPSQNKGFLVLKKGKGRFKGTFVNVLRNTKPKSMKGKLKVTKV